VCGRDLSFLIKVMKKEILNSLNGIPLYVPQRSSFFTAVLEGQIASNWQSIYLKNRSFFRLFLISNLLFWIHLCSVCYIYTLACRCCPVRPQERREGGRARRGIYLWHLRQNLSWIKEERLKGRNACFGHMDRSCSWKRGRKGGRGGGFHCDAEAELEVVVVVLKEKPQ